jgi:hypothetical protein
MIGELILTIGDPPISSHLKSCCSERYRVAADEDAVRASSAAMNASTCSRRMVATAVWHALTCEERRKEDTVVRVGADGPGLQVGCLQCRRQDGRSTVSSPTPVREPVSATRTDWTLYQRCARPREAGRRCKSQVR